ncbi:MAG: C39 family peptidase [Phycisphaerae bacterium]|jgi:hypothetical protein
MREKPIHYLQYDPNWGSIVFSNHNDPNQTIASSGCGATTMAMVAAAFVDTNISPPDVAALIVEQGYRTYDNGVDWGFYPCAAEYYGLKFEQTTDTDAAIEALRAGALVIASMGPGYFTSYGHYILLWGLDKENELILVNDPNSETRTRAGCGLFRDESCNYFIFYDPRPRQVELPVDVITIKIGGKAVTGKMVDGVSYAPVRALCEALGCTVTWDGDNRTVTVT